MVILFTYFSNQRKKKECYLVESALDVVSHEQVFIVIYNVVVIVLSTIY